MQNVFKLRLSPMKLDFMQDKLPVYIGVVSTLLVVPALADPINIPKFWILVSGAGLCLWKLSSNSEFSFSSSRRSLLLLSLFFFGTLLLATFFGKSYSNLSIVGTWGRNNGLLTYVALLIVLISLSVSKKIDVSVLTIKSMTVLGLIESAYGLMQIADMDPISWVRNDNVVILTLGNSNFASALLGLTAIATLTYILQNKTSFAQKFILIPSYCFQFYLVFKSDALQGLIILVFGSAVVGLVYIRNTPNIAIRRIFIPTSIMMFSIGLVSVFGIFGKGPLANFISGNQSSLLDRYYHWVSAIKMMNDNFFFGVGLDAFGEFYRQYRVSESIRLRGIADVGTNNAHNVFLQLGATGGVLLLLSYIMLTFFILWRAFKALKNCKDKVLVGGLLGIWLAYQIQALVSIDQIGLAVWGWISAGCLISLSYVNNNENVPKKIDVTKLDERSTKRKPKFDLLKGSAFIIGILPLIWTTPLLVNSFTLKSHIDELVQSRTDIELHQNSVDLYKFSRSLAAPEPRIFVFDFLIKANEIDLALELSKETTKKFPQNFSAWDQLARFHETTGSKQLAINAREKTVELDPLNQEIANLLKEDLSK